MGIVERWNGGMDFFPHPFCLLVCLVTVILWLRNKSRHSVDKNSSETFRHVFYQVLFQCKLAIAAWK